MDKKKKVKKEPLKTRNPYKYHRNWYYGLKASKWLSVITPFVAIFGAKFNDYFVVMAEGEQVKLSMGCMLACAIFGLTIWNESKKRGDGSKESTPVHGVIGWGVSFMLAFLLNSIIQDIVMILGCAFAGQLVALGFEFVAQNQYYYMQQYKEYKIKEDIKLSMQQKANREALGQITGKRPPIN